MHVHPMNRKSSKSVEKISFIHECRSIGSENYHYAQFLFLADLGPISTLFYSIP